MGFIPLFITVGGACVLFFLTVRNALRRKIEVHKVLLTQLESLYPGAGIPNQVNVDPDLLLGVLNESGKPISPEAFEIIRTMKINRYQYNRLIKKAPYNWIAKIAAYTPI